MPSELDQVVARCETILAQCLVAANQAAAAAASIGAAGLAPLESPTFTGTPRAPTASIGMSSTQIATTEFIARLLGQPSGVATLDSGGVIPLAQLPFSGLTYDGTWNATTNINPTLTSSFGTAGHFFVVTVAGTTNLNGITSWAAGDWALFSSVWTKVPYVAPPISNLPLTSLEGISSPRVVANLTGTASPQAIPISSLTPFINVAAAGSAGLLPALPGGTDVFLRGDGNYATPPGSDLSPYALLNSPAFTGTATVSTQARNNMGSAIASTQFVVNQQGQSTEVGLLRVNGTASAGTSTYGTKIDHIHPTDTSRASAVNPQMSGSAGVYNGTMNITGNHTVNGTSNVVGTFAVNGTTVLTGPIMVGQFSLTTTLNGTLTLGAVTINGTFSGGIVQEGNLTLADVTTNNTSTSKHGFAPKLDNVSTHFLNGQGGWTTPASGLQTASTGLVAVGNDVEMDTNNSGGLGSYRLLINAGVGAIADGGTSNNLNNSTFNSGGVLVAGNPTGGTWRNVTGESVQAGGAGVFIRVS